MSTPTHRLPIETRIEMAVEKNLGKSNLRLLCDLPADMDPHTVLPMPASFAERWLEKFMLIVIAPEECGPQQQRLIGAYIRKAESAVVLIERPAALHTGSVNLGFELADPKPVALGRVEGGASLDDEDLLGHLHWEPDELVKQVHKVAAIAQRLAGKTGKASLLAVVADDKALLAIATNALMAMRVPVQISRSALLQLRPGVMDVMYLLAAATGISRFVSVARMLDYVRHLGPVAFKGLLKFYEGGMPLEAIAGFDARRDVQCDLRTLAMGGFNDPFMPAIHAVEQAFAVHGALPKAERRHRDLLAHFTALKEYARNFETTWQLVREWWRQQLLLEDWTGFLPGSGIEIAEFENYRPEQAQVVVYLCSARAIPSSAQIISLGEHVITAPVTDCGCDVVPEEILQAMAVGRTPVRTA